MCFLLNGTSLYLPRHLSLDAIRQKHINHPGDFEFITSVVELFVFLGVFLFVDFLLFQFLG